MENMAMVCKIAILNCPGGRDWGPIYISYLDTYVKPTRFTYEYTVVNLSDVTETNRQLDENDFDGYVITGSTFNAYDNDDWIVNIINHIQAISRTSKNLLGICFGHQIISRALGGHVCRSKKGWGIGPRSVNLTTDGHNYLQKLQLKYTDMLSHEEADISCRPLEDVVVLNHSHQDQVTEPPLDVLRCAGGNTHCPYAAMYRPSGQTGEVQASILTFQGHPEFSSALMLEIMAMLNETGAYSRICPQTGEQISTLGGEFSLEEVDRRVGALSNDMEKERHALHSSAIGKCIVAFLCSKCGE